MYRLLRAAAVLSTCFLFAVGANGQTLSHLSNSERSPIAAALVEDRYSKANELRLAGKNQEALTVINEAIRFDSDCGKCFGLRSGIEGNLQMHQQGVADGFTGIERSKTLRDKAMAAYNKGFNLGGLGRDGEALEAYDLSIEFDPMYALAHFGKGKALYFLQRWVESKAALESALKINPKLAAAWAYLAEDQMNLGDHQAGFISANKAIELAPSDPRGYRARTIAYYWDHNYEAMLADATHTLELDPTRPHAHLLRGHALKLLKRDDESANEYSLEPDRTAVEAGLNPPQRVDTRIYNCGDTSTEIQTPMNFNGNGFTDCLKRIGDQWDDIIRQLEALPTPKRPVPGRPPKKATSK